MTTRRCTVFLEVTFDHERRSCPVEVNPIGVMGHKPHEHAACVKTAVDMLAHGLRAAGFENVETGELEIV